MDIARVHHLMTELGPLLDLAEVVEFASQSLWTLAFDDGSVIEAELDEAHHRLVLSIDVAELPAASEAARLRTLLEFNLLWRRTGGLRFALAGGTVVQMLELGLDRLDLPTLATVLKNFHASARHWGPLLVVQPSAADIPSAPLAGGALRV